MSQSEPVADSPYQRQLRQLAGLEEKNRRLTESLVAARGQLAQLRGQLAGLTDPPGTYGLFVEAPGDGSAIVNQQGRQLRVAVDGRVDLSGVAPGQTVALNQNLALVGAGGYQRSGPVAQVAELLSEDRVLVTTRGEEEQVVRRAGSLKGVKLRLGDAVVIDPRGGFAFEVVGRSHAEDLAPQEVPDVEYADIGGLATQLDQIRDAIELPFAHPELFAEYGLRAPKGVLLYGPPGCGKTLIAKAVARSLSSRSPAGGQATFINIKGPELLNKYVGETERHVRAIFARARERAAQGGAVVVFCDEMEALFRTRGTGISSDVETTVVPQLLAEIDGVEALGNVIVIGASNREDLIDPAILRPGRLDVKVRIDRPDRAAAVDIFGKYLHPGLPIGQAELAAHGGDAASATVAMAGAVADRLYSTDPGNRFLEVTYASGDKEVLFYKDFASGAMIKAIVDRAKKAGIKDKLANGHGGITTAHLLEALADELAQNEDLPGTTNPDDWARVSGRKGERIVYLRTFARGGRHVEV